MTEWMIIKDGEIQETSFEFELTVYDLADIEDMDDLVELEEMAAKAAGIGADTVEKAARKRMKEIEPAVTVTARVTEKDWEF